MARSSQTKCLQRKNNITQRSSSGISRICLQRRLGKISRWKVVRYLALRGSFIFSLYQKIIMCAYSRFINNYNIIQRSGAQTRVMGGISASRPFGTFQVEQFLGLVFLCFRIFLLFCHDFCRSAEVPWKDALLFSVYRIKRHMKSMNPIRRDMTFYHSACCLPVFSIVELTDKYGVLI